eukprot:CAMPEP_0201116412 /NCGR_PEP_ID=MMETSP0850-20130426/709_1 /ASSEMBLY_ACC=CAM_ASM_000622 /TAXON_ID=183588 /ORGANISM="Pseudo-nitzschia fraudulenta, Strain WWA7" /LENGTH=103 /DNA_ID=CAMNT_0047380485 /DNA_START=51 /DNA_END=362 /DNA_ORIENTATION=+
MNIQSILTFFALFAAVNAEVRGTTRRREDERSTHSTKSRYIDVANDINESSLTKIKQRYLMTRIGMNAETGLYTAFEDDDDAPEMSMSASMSISMSMSMSMSM